MTERQQATFWLALCALTGLVVLLLWRDSCQADGGIHYVLAHWAWQHKQLFVDVWSRPLFTLLYAFPALISYQAARALTIIVCVATAYHTWRAATEHNLARAPLVIPFLFLQPSFTLFIADTMTEPLYALVFIIALRLHLKSRLTAAALVASTLILIRPEAIFTCSLWAWWLWRESQSQISNLKFKIPLLSAGMFAWWLASWLITGDVLFIKHNWPSNWPFSGTIYGAPGFLNYPARLPEIIGPLFLIPFAVGLWRYLKRRSAVAQDGILCHSGDAWLSLFLIHTVMRAFGLMGSAGYPRYLLTLAPAAALITLAGWNALADKFAHWSLPVRRAVAIAVIALSACLNFLYVDGAEWMRDAVLIDRMMAKSPSLPVNRFIWSQPYMCMRFGADPWQNEFFTTDKNKNAELMRAMPAGTLVFWDRLSGPKWTDVKIEDFQANGFQLLYEEEAVLNGYVIPRSFFGVGGPRHQRMAFLYKASR
jgi:hypothetical protein